MKFGEKFSFITESFITFTMKKTKRGREENSITREGKEPKGLPFLSSTGRPEINDPLTRRKIGSNEGPLEGIQDREGGFQHVYPFSNAGRGKKGSKGGALQGFYAERGGEKEEHSLQESPSASPKRGTPKEDAGGKSRNV